MKVKDLLMLLETNEKALEGLKEQAYDTDIPLQTIKALEEISS